MTRTLRVLAVAAAWVLAATGALALADSFTPVRLAIHIAATARLHRPLAVRVTVDADPGVLDTRTGPLRIIVRLAPECGGVPNHTGGTVLLNRRLSPQPATGHAYRATAHGSGRPSRLGTQTVCTWLEDSAATVFASDQSVTVKVRRR